jgi:hypothetical protein
MKIQDAAFQQWKQSYVVVASQHGYTKPVCFACYLGEDLMPIIDGDLRSHWEKFHQNKTYPQYTEAEKQHILDRSDGRWYHKNEGADVKKIYVASSWHNPYQADVVKTLLRNNFTVYDFRQPATTFNWVNMWEKFDHDWQQSNVQNFVRLLNDPVPTQGFNADYSAMEQADACVMILPCGNSAHMETGYFWGAKKPFIIYIPAKFQVELMYKRADLITDNLDAVIQKLHQLQSPPINSAALKAQFFNEDDDHANN